MLTRNYSGNIYALGQLLVENTGHVFLFFRLLFLPEPELEKNWQIHQDLWMRNKQKEILSVDD